jgi:hypothetical protein
MPGGGDTQNVQQRADPWAGAIPYLQGQAAQPASQDVSFSDGNPVLAGQFGRQQVTGPGIPGKPAIPGILPEAARLYQEHNPSFFPGSTVAQFSPEQTQAQDLTAQRATQGSDVLRSAQQNNLATTRGDYLYGGQGFNAAFDAAARKINPMMDSAFARSGRAPGTSGLADVAKTQALGDSFANLYGDERQRQQQASVLAPGLASADYNDYGQLANVGAQKQALGQSNIDEQVARHDFAQNAPYQKLQNFASFLNPVLGAGGTQTSPVFSNPLGQALGAGLSGSQIFKNLGGSMGANPSWANAGMNAGILGASGVGAGVAGMSFADALAAGLIAL